MKEYTEAEQACIDIYKDYSQKEIDCMASSIVSAWYIGKELLRGYT